jgi:hypothetical protein
VCSPPLFSTVHPLTVHSVPSRSSTMRFSEAHFTKPARSLADRDSSLA